MECSSSSSELEIRNSNRRFAITANNVDRVEGSWLGFSIARGSSSSSKLQGGRQSLDRVPKEARNASLRVLLGLTQALECF